MTADGRKRLGAMAEARAARHLEEQGCAVLERNWRCRLGEIDLVCRDGDQLVFVEVRARRGSRFGAPEESIGARKRRKLEQLATAYVQSVSWPGPWRIDVVTLRYTGSEAPTLRHYPSAFGP